MGESSDSILLLFRAVGIVRICAKNVVKQGTEAHK